MSEAKMLEIQQGPLDVDALLLQWDAKHRTFNHGALSIFVGTIRKEGGIEALSFDLYLPILQSWFDAWQQKLQGLDSYLFMAHSQGDVPLKRSSFLAAVSSPKRRVALEFLDSFVEDFKNSAPIWKYDVIQGERVYAKERSTPLQNAGLLS